VLLRRRGTGAGRRSSYVHAQALRLLAKILVPARHGHIERRLDPVAFAPVAVQFVGRWGLYRFVTHKFNIVPGTPYYDAFEDRKQPLELAAVLGGVAVACLA